MYHADYIIPRDQPNRSQRSIMKLCDVGIFDDGAKPLHVKEIIEARENHGFCPLCGITKIRRKKACFSKGFRMAPITKDGEAYKGFCLRCLEMEEILAELGNQETRGKFKKTKDYQCFMKGKALASPMVLRNDYEAIYNNDNSPFACKNEPETNNREKFRVRMKSSGRHARLDIHRNDNLHSTDVKSLATASTDNSDERELDSIIENIVKHSDSATKVASLYSQLAEYHLTKRKVSPNTIDVVLDTMANHIRNADVQHHGCRALRKLTTTGKQSDSVGFSEITKYCCRIENHHSGISTLIAAMSSNKQSLPVQKEAMHVIRNITHDSATSRNLIVKSRGLQAFIRAMRDFDESACLQGLGCYLLHKLAHKNSVAQDIIVEKNGVLIVLEAMSFHSPVEMIQIYGCAALNTLSLSKMHIAQEILDTDGLDIILSILKTHVGSEKLTACAMELVANLGTLSEGTCFVNDFESDCSAIDDINNTMRTHAKSLNVQKNACLLVKVIARSLSSVEIFLECSQLRFSLRDAADKFAFHCKRSVDLIFQLIGEI